MQTTPTRRSNLVALALTTLWTLMPTVCGADWTARLIADLTTDYPKAVFANTMFHACSSAPAGGIARVSVYIHPLGAGPSRATARYPVELPAIASDEAVWLLFAIGLRDGWEEATDAEHIDGVVFQALVNDTVVYSEHWRAHGWGERAVDLTVFAGQRIALTLGADRAGNANADWAHFAEPRVVIAKQTEAALPPITCLINGQPAGADAWTVDKGAVTVRSDQSVIVQRPVAASGKCLLVSRVVSAATATITGELTRHNQALNAYDVLGETTLTLSPQTPALLMIAANVPPSTQPVLARLRWQGAPELTAAPFAATVTALPRIVVAHVGPARGIVSPGDEVDLVARVENHTPGEDGPRAARLRLQPPAGSTLISGDPTQSVLALPAPAGATATWRIRAPETTGITEGTLFVEDVSESAPIVLRVVPAAPELPNVTPVSGRLYRHGETVVIETATARLAFVGDGADYYYGLLEGWDGQRWRRLGALPHLGWGLLRSEAGHRYQAFFNAQQALGNSGGLVLIGKHTDAAAVTWSTGVTCLIQDDGFALTCVMQADDPANVLALRGPTVLVGETSFGARKDLAIFPGLEYLEGGEVSSSTRDILYPGSNRAVPHPLRITVPVMAVENAGFVTALGWAIQDQWDGAHRYTNALFSSPNRLENQNNHLLGLWIPHTPDYVGEGEASATTPYRLLPGTAITLRGILWARPATATDAVTWWAARFGWPAPGASRDSLLDYLRLARHAMINTMWNEEQQGYAHAIGWQPGITPGNATLMLFDGWLARSEEEQKTSLDHARRVIDGMIARDAAVLHSGQGSHVMFGELPFYAGYVFENVDRQVEYARTLAATMNSDGLWLWSPYAKDELRSQLGAAGETASGICDRRAFHLLRIAHISGDAELTAAARKAVNALRRFRVPRGAQTWECPLHAPDILSSAYMVRAFVEAYELFGDPAYLADARAWAQTGLPFVYLWYRNDIPQMPYATIPIFGATHFTISWLGVPVQWCGLEYSYALFQLLRHDNAHVWKRLAEGITMSGIRQTYPEGPSKGALPDSWHLIRNVPQPADIAPSSLMVNVFAALGHDPGVKFARIGPLVAVSGAVISSTEVDMTDAKPTRIAFDAMLLRGATSYTLLRELSAPPSTVNVGGAAAAQVGDATALRETARGWQYDAAKQRMALKVTHEASPTRVEIRW